MKQMADMTALKERHLDMMIKLAFDLDDAEETRRLLDEPETELSAEEERLADGILAQAFQKAEEREKARKRQRRRAAIRRAMPRVALIASCLILVLTIAVPIAIASSPVLRSRVMRLIVQVDEEQGKVSYDFVADPDAAFDVPEGWLGDYFPAYIPEGFSVWRMDEYMAAVEYRNAEEKQLYIGVFGNGAGGTTTGIDDDDIRYISIQGNRAQLIEGNLEETHPVTITWANDTRVFVVASYNMDTDVVIRVAQSIRKIVK